MGTGHVGGNLLASTVILIESYNNMITYKFQPWVSAHQLQLHISGKDH